MSMKHLSYLFVCTSIALATVACGTTESATGDVATDQVSDTTTTDTSDETQASDESENTSENETGTESETDTGTDTTTDTSTETDTNTDEGTEVDPDAGTETETDTNTETDTETDTSTEPEETTPADPSSFSCPDDDPYEDNDSFENALALEPGVALEAIACSLDGEFNHDNDTFKVDVAAGCEVRVDLAFVHAEGDLELACYSDGGERSVGNSMTESDIETVSYTPEADETVFMSVFPYMSMGNSYSILATVTCP